MAPILITVSALLSSLLLGLMAGFFSTYSFNVNQAMMNVDGSTYATVQSLFNINVRHAGFFLCFFGAGAIPMLTAILSLLSKHYGVAAIWFIVGITYIAGIIIYTHEVNLPLNDYTESWDPNNVPDDWQQIRERWNSANMLRTVLSIALFSVSLLMLAFPPHHSE